MERNDPPGTSRGGEDVTNEGGHYNSEEEVEQQAISYSRGRDKYDAYPEQLAAPSFEAFAEVVLSDRSTAKGLAWISASFKANSDGLNHRCRDGALPRRFLAFDLDGAAPDAFAELCMLLGAYSGFGYTTASHTAENPHARYMLELSRPVDRAEGIRLGAAMQWQIETRLGLGALKFDDSVYRGEQPIYGPLVNADVMYYGGNPIDVDAVLATAPEEPLRERPAPPDPYEALIIERRLFLHEIDPSKAAIICPFEKDHSERTSDSSTVYFRPLHNGYRWGRIHCSHTHCEGRHQEDYIRGLGAEPRDVWREQAREEPRVGEEPGEGGDGGNGVTPPPSAGKGNGAGAGEAKGGPRTIVVLAGKLPQSLDEAESALLVQGGVYQRGSLLVRVVTIPESRVTRSVRRHKGALVILPFDKAYLTESLTSAARWEMFNPKIEKFCTINCPKTIAEGLLARVGNWRFPVLAGIAEAPYMIDGHIYDAPGYEPRTGVYLNPGDNKFPEIPKKPTRKQAEEALQKLTDVVKDFPFVEDVDCAVWISALLTTFVRLGLRSAPMFGFTATVMGTGKSLLTDLISIIATGRRATVMTHALDSNEEKKRLLSVLIEGDPVLVVDNIGEAWGSDSMSAILTAETYKDRLLGVNKAITVPTTATWIATGNNLAFSGDLSTRVLVARLDPRCERPDERSFDRDLLTWVPEHRSELVAAALTVLAGHVAADSSDVLRPFGRFEDWSRLVRAAVVWLGMPDPCRARTHVEESDPVKQSLGAVLSAWWACFKGTPKTVGQAVSSGSDELRAALLIVSGERGAINLRKAGIWLAKYGGRVVDGLRFERAGLSQRSVLWTVAYVASGESVSFSESCSGRTCADGQNASDSEQTHQDSQTHQEARDGEPETGTI